MCQSCKLKPVLQRESKVVIGAYHCKQWKCPECGPRRTKMWRRRAEILSNLDHAFEQTRCPDRMFEKALIARLHREDLEFIKVRTNGGVVIVHQAFRGNRLTKCDQSAWFGRDRMLETVDRLMADVTHQPGVRAVTCSAALRPKPEEAEESPWRHVGYAPQSLTTINRMLLDAGESPIIMGRAFDARLLSMFLVHQRESSSQGYKTEDQNRLRTTTASLSPSKTAIM